MYIDSTTSYNFLEYRYLCFFKISKNLPSLWDPSLPNYLANLPHIYICIHNNFKLYVFWPRVNLFARGHKPFFVPFPSPNYFKSGERISGEGITGEGITGEGKTWEGISGEGKSSCILL